MKTALYFGYGSGGHFLRGLHSNTLDPQRDVPDFPWTISHLDTGLLENRKVPDSPDGRVYWTCGGDPLWFAFVWWDRSGDRRPGSNSGFYVLGFGPKIISPETALTAALEAAALEAFAYAQEQWPSVVARQEFPLSLVHHE